jgi:hypothetical protein
MTRAFAALAVFFWAVTVLSAQQPQPIAARYPNDTGIARDPRVVFADDFDDWETGTGKHPEGRWDGSLNNLKERDQQHTVASAGKVQVGDRPGPGKNVLLLEGRAQPLRADAAPGELPQQGRLPRGRV